MQCSEIYIQVYNNPSTFLFSERSKGYYSHDRIYSSTLIYRPTDKRACSKRAYVSQFGSDLSSPGLDSRAFENYHLLCCPFTHRDIDIVARKQSGRRHMNTKIATPYIQAETEQGGPAVTDCNFLEVRITVVAFRAARPVAFFAR
jgi:hypothetical protein